MKYTVCCNPTQDGIFDTVLTDRCYSSGGGGQGGLICLSVTLSSPSYGAKHTAVLLFSVHVTV